MSKENKAPRKTMASSPPSVTTARVTNKKTGRSTSKTVGIKRMAKPRTGTHVTGGRYNPTLTAVPVAFENGSMRPFTRIMSNKSGDSYTAHVLDRLDPVTLNSATDNVTGNLIYNTPINPELLGERLRRIASCFEFYKFGFIRMHFISALGTQFGGSILGMFDSDPVDTFDLGIASLRAAAAHPTAAAHKIWNDSTWTAPRLKNGPFYVDVNASDSASIRQQQQGSFNLLIDAAITLAGGTIAYPLTLGNFYVEYMVHLTMPTIQTNFYGSFMQSSAVIPEFSGGQIGATGVQSFFQSASLVTLLKENAIGTLPLTFVALPANPDLLQGVRLGTGVWNVSFGVKARFGTANVLRQTYSQFMSGNTLTIINSPTMIKYEEGTADVPVQNGSNGAAIASRAGNFFNSPTDTTTTFRGMSCRVFVPPNESYIWVPVWRDAVTTSICFISSLFLEVTVAVPTPQERDLLSPSSMTVANRLAMLEARLANPLPVPSDTKDDDLKESHLDSPGYQEWTGVSPSDDFYSSNVRVNRALVRMKHAEPLPPRPASHPMPPGGPTLANKGQ